MLRKYRRWILKASFIFMIACGGESGSNDFISGDAGSTDDTEVSTSGDTSLDGDTDVDTDADTDVDTDGDTDSTNDSDTDSANDNDTVSKTDTESDITTETVDAFPEVTITSPENNASFSRGEEISFHCVANDQEDGTLPGSAVLWSSSLTGGIGIGAEVINALAVPGDHTITCAGTDSAGQTSTDSIVIHIVDNYAPEAKIDQPIDGDFFKTGTSIQFQGTASDTEDGPITGAGLTWHAGGVPIGVGETIQTALTEGDHIVTLRAVDSSGAEGTDTITIHVVSNLPPKCSITSPGDNSSVVEGASISFEAICTDPDGTAVPGSDVSWSSDKDGKFGIGYTVVNGLSTIGVHEITVCAVDTTDSNLQSCDTITVTVKANQPPEITSMAPENASSHSACQKINLHCSATDPEGQHVSYSWTSSAEGPIGTTSFISWSPQMSGTHILTCTAKDELGKSTTSQITITVDSPRVAINHPADGAIFRPGEMVNLSGNACDTEDGAITDTGLEWHSDVDDFLGTGQNLPIDSLSPGPHTISLRAMDSDFNVRYDSVDIWINEPPQVTIISPDDQATFNTNDVITFDGEASDPEDGVLTPTWWDSVRGEFFEGSTTSGSGLLPGKREVVLAATDGAGETAEDKVTIFIEGEKPLFASPGDIQSRVYQIIEDPDTGEWWVATNEGLVLYDPASGDTTVFRTWNSDIPDNNVRDIIILENGTLMVATDDGLLKECKRPGLTDCQYYDKDDFNVDSNQMTALLELPDGTTLIGTSECMIYSDWTESDHQDYCEGDGGGDELVGDSIRDLVYDDSTGKVWIATDRGVSLMTPSGNVMNRNSNDFVDYTTDEGLASDNVRAIAIAPLSNDVWFATGQGLTRLERSGLSQKFSSYNTSDGIPSNNVRDLAIDVITVGAEQREVTWGATGAGLARVDVTTPSVVSITQADGLANDNCFSIFIDSSHFKNVGTESGLIIYRGF